MTRFVTKQWADDMDVNDARQQKWELQKTLSREINEFMERTGLAVDDVEFSAADVTQIQDTTKRIHASVYVRVVL